MTDKNLSKLPCCPKCNGIAFKWLGAINTWEFVKCHSCTHQFWLDNSDFEDYENEVEEPYYVDAATQTGMYDAW